MGDYGIIIRTGAFFERPGGCTDEHKTGDLFVLAAKGIAHRIIKRGPSREPPTRKAERMSCMEHVHHRCASRKFLLP